MKNFLLQKFGSSRYFSGSLAVFEERGEPACGRAADYGGLPRRLRRRNAFELFLEYSTSKEFASDLLSLRFARRLNCKGFWAKKSVGDFVLGKENFLIKTI